MIDLFYLMSQYLSLLILFCLVTYVFISVKKLLVVWIGLLIIVVSSVLGLLSSDDVILNSTQVLSGIGFMFCVIGCFLYCSNKK
jgi:hypothetical protein